MSERGKYQPLFEHLHRSCQDELTFSFAEVEALLGRPLPASANKSSAWWSNRSKGALQATAWTDAGYYVVQLDLDNRRVTFRRPRPIYKIAGESDTQAWDANTIRDLRRHLGLTQAQFANELGVRQQTVSEWENGVYLPTRATSKLLTMVAERAEQKYMKRN